ncbi:hypothetical protein DL96DRAFT_1694673 [Flagelloscypha sp. PMI_526]|nr:hypothetical protein DL96DRAFT_1694673 [Flagelloscypha sp. PMI_526]
MADVKQYHVKYNDIHNLIRKSTPKIAQNFNPNLLIAIGGGLVYRNDVASSHVSLSAGFFPARVMRTLLREQTECKDLQIQAIGLSLYEALIRTQWLGPDSGKLLLGKRSLIVDEVDDTRKTLHYALSELQKDVEAELSERPEEEREALRKATKFAIFVVHNKLKPKLADLPPDLLYFSGEDVDDIWLNYPWEAVDIEAHDTNADKDAANA